MARRGNQEQEQEEQDKPKIMCSGQVTLRAHCKGNQHIRKALQKKMEFRKRKKREEGREKEQGREEGREEKTVSRTLTTLFQWLDSATSEAVVGGPDTSHCTLHSSQTVHRVAQRQIGLGTGSPGSPGPYFLLQTFINIYIKVTRY